MLEPYVVSKVVPFKRESVKGEFAEGFNTYIGKYEEVLVSKVMFSVPVSISQPGIGKSWGCVVVGNRMHEEKPVKG
jgi:hypothetical protein